MGGGASRRQAKKKLEKLPPLELGAGVESFGHFLLGPNPSVGSLSSLKRRRRVLLGREGLCPFERVVPTRQGPEMGMYCQASLARAVYDSCEKNAQGNVERKDLVAACRKNPLFAEFVNLPRSALEDEHSDEIQRIFNTMDRDNDGIITWEEFFQFFQDQRARNRQAAAAGVGSGLLDAAVGGGRLPGSKGGAYEDGDAVFQKLSNNEVRAMGVEMSRAHNDHGMLDAAAVDKLLGYGLGHESQLALRLLKVAMVCPIYQDRASGSHAEPEPVVFTGKPRHQAPTSQLSLSPYELLSLTAFLRTAPLEDLLELLFCIFDIDGDDLVSVEDFEVAIGWFSQLQMALAGVTGMAAVEEFESAEDEIRRQEARALANEVVGFYSGASGSEEAQAFLGSDLEGGTAKAPRSSVTSAGSQKGASKTGEAHPDDASNASSSSFVPSSAKGDVGGAGTPKSSPGAKLEPHGPVRAPQAKVAAKSKATPKENAKPKSKGGCFVCCGGGKAKDTAKDEVLPRLNFEQWLRWIKLSGAIPEDSANEPKSMAIGSLAPRDGDDDSSSQSRG